MIGERTIEAIDSELLRYLSEEELAEVDSLLEASKYDWENIARPNQLAPEGDWITWLILAGRGFGKTRSICEWLRHRVESGEARRIGIITPTAADYRDIIVNGESGILAISPDWNRPIWEPSKRCLRWNNGATAICFSSAEPESLRGYQFDTLLSDEVGSWKYQQETWDMAQFGLRLGKNPKQVVATTPKPHKLIRALLKDKTVTVTRGSTFQNKDNLAEPFLNAILGKYEGTRLGRQEIYAEVLDDLEGALWQREWIESQRLKEAPETLKRVVVGVDPSGSSTGNECGIIVAATSEDKRYLVLADYSVQGSPSLWSSKVLEAYQEYSADCIAVERNYGGEMVEQVLRTTPGGAEAKIKLVTATRGKAVRAEPISALYEQHKVSHIGMFATLEDELCGWDATAKQSPNRLDALVWALTDLSGRSSYCYVL